MRAVNLLSHQQDLGTDAARDSRAIRQTLLVAAAALLLLSAIVGVAFTREHRAVAQRQAELKAVRAQLASIQSTAAAVAAARTRIERRYDAVIEVAGARVPWDRLLDGVSRVIPSGAWLTQLAAQPSGVDPADPAAPGPSAASSAPMTIQGYARSQDVVADVLRRLTYVPTLTDVSLQQTQKTDVGARKAIQFTIVASVRSSRGNG